MEMAGLQGTAGGGSARDVQARNLLARLGELVGSHRVIPLPKHPSSFQYHNAVLVL